MTRYRIVESVGTRREPVREYDDLEIHHPSHRGKEPGRTYREIAGRKEEILSRGGNVVLSRDGQVFVSKDFILLDDETGRKDGVLVPAPASGCVRVDRRGGVVQIFDSLPGGEMIAQIRHMDLRDSTLKDGDRIRYGEPMGLQSGMGGGDPHRYPAHVHIDFNAAHLGQFRRYIADIASGRIRQPARVEEGEVTPVRRAHGDASMPTTPASDDRAVARLQSQLASLGYRDERGQTLQADGVFGRRTREALLAFQRAHGLTADGIAGPQTQAALRRAVESPTPVDPVHPQHALYRQVLAGVEALDQALGRAADAASLRLAARLTWLAREQGLTRVDRVVLSEDPVRGVRGERVFVWQGRPGEAGQRWAGIETHTALATPVEASFQGLAAFERGLAPAWAREQAEATLRHTAYRDGLRPGIAP